MILRRLLRPFLNMSRFLNSGTEQPLTLKERMQWSRFFKGEKPVKGPIQLNHRRIFILPTRSGLGFGLLLLLLMLIAFVYNNNLAYLLCFLLTSIFVVTILHTFRSLAGLKVQVGQYKPVFAGEVAAITLHIDNPSTYPRYQVQVSLEQTATAMLAANTQQAFTLHLTAPKRGLQVLGTIRLSSTFPLGLFRAWSPLRFDYAILVYPKPGQRVVAFPDALGDAAQAGLANKRGGDDFSALQEYQAGDAPKHIHWKAFAKGQGLLTKHYQQDYSTEVYLDYAFTPGYSVEERLSQLCRWVIDAEAAGIRYGFKIPGLSLAPALGSAHTAQCLQALALF